MSVLTRMARCALLTAVLASAFGVGPVLAQDFTVNLKETDIQELIKFVAEATGTTIVVDPAVKGKVKVISRSRYRVTNCTSFSCPSSRFTAIPRCAPGGWSG